MGSAVLTREHEFVFQKLKEKNTNRNNLNLNSEVSGACEHCHVSVTQLDTSASPTCSHMAVRSPLSCPCPQCWLNALLKAQTLQSCHTGDNRCEQGSGKWRRGTQSKHKPF